MGMCNQVDLHIRRLFLLYHTISSTIAAAPATSRGHTCLNTPAFRAAWYCSGSRMFVSSSWLQTSEPYSASKRRMKITHQGVGFILCVIVLSLRFAVLQTKGHE
jgi:hypothetical protein